MTENKLTGLEAWCLIAPIIAQYCPNNDEMQQAYVMTFAALKKYDEGRKNKQE